MCLVLALSGISAAGEVSADTAQEVERLFMDLADRFQAQDANGFLDLFHPSAEEPSRDILQQVLKAKFAKEKPTHVQWKVNRLVAYDQDIVAHTTVTKTSGTDNTNPTQREELYILKPHNKRLLIQGMYEKVPVDQYNEQTGLYSDPKAGFSLTIPAGWTALQGPLALKGLTIGSFTVLAPDLQSKVMGGLVQMPLKLADDDVSAAQKGAQADNAVEEMESQNHRVCEQGPTTVEGKGGYYIITEFQPKEADIAKRKRLRVYFSDHPILYFLVCDAIGPEKFDTLRTSFDTMIQSFTLLPPAEGMSRQESLAAAGAQGNVSGRVYTSEEYNCFIGAPEGWEIRTSPNPAHLVEMQYTQGKSIARLIGAKGLDAGYKLKDVFEHRLDSLKQIIKEFSETSRRDVTLRGVPGIESTQTYNVPELGTFHVKEVTLIHNGIYYLILCQCIEPDDFTVLEKDFDSIIESFGFIQ